MPDQAAVVQIGAVGAVDQLAVSTHARTQQRIIVEISRLLFAAVDRTHRRGERGKGQESQDSAKKVLKGSRVGQESDSLGRLSLRRWWICR